MYRVPVIFFYVYSIYVFIVGMRNSGMFAKAVDVQSVAYNFQRLKLRKTSFLSRQKKYNFTW